MMEWGRKIDRAKIEGVRGERLFPNPPHFIARPIFSFRPRFTM